MNRRESLKLGVFSLAAMLAGQGISALSSKNQPNNNLSMTKPKKLSPGSKVSIVAPGSAVTDPDSILYAANALKHFGLQYELSPHILKGSGYKTRTVTERVSDLHHAFSSDSDAILCIRGGYGSGQLLDDIDYDLIKKNPKIIAGFSDITTLLIAINKICGLITFHTPVLMSAFSDYTAKIFKNMLFGENSYPKSFGNPETISGIRAKYPTREINPGSANGKLIGGNLSLICSLMGTPYEIVTEGKILFLEDVGEQPYRIDRMLTQLKQSGKLATAAGIIFGDCNDCTATYSRDTWDASLGEVLDGIFKDIDVPVFSGLMIGHSVDQISLPLGIEAEMNTAKGEISLLESPIT